MRLAGKSVAASATVQTTIENTQDIGTYFTGYGFEVDLSTAAVDKVKIPKKWDDSFAAFNQIVQESGLDLADYKGKVVVVFFGFTQCPDVCPTAMAELAASAPGRWFTEPFIAAQPARVALAQGWIAGIAPEGYAACCEALAQADLRSAIAAIRVPTLLIAGASDPVTTVADAKAMQRAIAGARLAEVPASHLSNLEAPAAFDDALAAFLAMGA